MATSLSTPAVFWPAWRYVACRTIVGVLLQLRSIRFCSLLASARSLLARPEDPQPWSPCVVLVDWPVDASQPRTASSGPGREQQPTHLLQLEHVPRVNDRRNDPSVHGAQLPPSQTGLARLPQVHDIGLRQPVQQPDLRGVLSATHAEAQATLIVPSSEGAFAPTCPDTPIPRQTEARAVPTCPSRGVRITLVALLDATLDLVPDCG
jgi:hypothetical protein